MRMRQFWAVFFYWFPLVVSAQTGYVPGQVYFGTDSFVEYRAGNLPIIITAPHGGYLEPASIPDRNCGGCVTIRDAFTEEMAMQMDTAIQQILGGRAHIIMNKLARIKLDANREIVEAAQGNPQAELAWHEFHGLIQAAKDSSVARYGTALLIDVHGHGHVIQRLELGYLITRSELQLTDAQLQAQGFKDSTGIRHLMTVLNPATPIGDILRGPESLGEMYIGAGYPNTPSQTDPAPAPNDPYFSGGYDVRRHGSEDSSTINAIQIELNRDNVRNTYTERKDFSEASACIFRDYIDRWMFAWDTLAPLQPVSSTADSGPGSLREALARASSGDTIRFAPSIWGDTILLNSELVVCGDIVLMGPGRDQLAISGQNQTRIVRTIHRHTVEIRGLSLLHGSTPPGEDGGAVLNRSHLTLRDCYVGFCFADDDGGALSNEDSATVLLDSCHFEQNICGDDGGALRNPSGAGTMTIQACFLEDNQSPSNGGALSNGGTATIRASTFYRNSAGSNGGAIRSFGGIVDVENSTFYGNLAGNRGGCISTTADMDLRYCTLVENTAASLGGGIRLLGGSTVLLQNSLVAYNQGSAEHDVSLSSGGFASAGTNLIRDTTGSGWAPATGDLLGSTAMPFEPLLDSLGDNGGGTPTVALRCMSPAHEAGTATGLPALDQRGLPRVSGAAPDIGAYEQQGPLGLALNFMMTDVSVFGGSDGTIALTVAQGTPPFHYMWSTGDSTAAIGGLPAGTYNVLVTDSLGCTVSDSVTVGQPVSLTPATASTALKLVPNPASAAFGIEFEGLFSFPAQLNVLNVNGRVVYRRLLSKPGRIRVVTSGWPAGIYFVQMRNAQAVHSARLSLQK